VFAWVFAKTSIVGYQTVEGLSSDKFKALAVQFENIAGGEIAIKDLVTVGTPAGSAEFDFSADQIWRWNTKKATWTKYYYRTKRDVITGWCNSDSTTETTDTIPAGEGFFFRRATGAVEDTITFTAPSAE